MAENDWCDILGINRPALDAAKGHREANSYSLLIVALLERGEPMTLHEVAARFDAVGVAEYGRALRSLQRCKPARAPVYRDGERYALDPHDAKLDLWAFRLGLRPPKRTPIRVVRPEPAPLRGPNVPLTVAELDEAWNDGNLLGWSAQRVALAVLDAHAGPLPSAVVVAFVAKRTQWHRLRDDSRPFNRKGCPIAVSEEGRWSVAPDADHALRATRKAVRARVEAARRYALARPDLSVLQAQGKAAERRRAVHAEMLAALSRALLVGFPATAPRVVTLLDIDGHSIETFVDDALDQLQDRLADCEIIGAQNVRGLLRALNIDAADKRLAELGPPQKRKTLNKRGRTLKITTELLVRGSCGIGTPFGAPKTLSGYLVRGEFTKLRRRLESDAKSLYALYEYGRLHGAVRLRWGFLDEYLPAPWVHRDEPTLRDLKRAALDRGAALEMIVGTAPGWSDPWARAQRVHLERDPSGWGALLIDELGDIINDADVQRARLAGD